MALKFSTGLRNAMGDGLTAYVGPSAVLKLLSGTKPASPTGSGGEETTVLATFTCNATFAGAASNGVVTLNGIPAVNATADGVATWFRIYQDDGTTWCMDGTVSTLAAGTGDLQIDNTTLITDTQVAVSGTKTITIGNA